MAGLISLRLRRTLTLLNRNFTSLSSPPTVSSSTSSFYPQNYLKTQIACFKSSLPLQSSRYGNNNRNDEEAIDPNAVLFEGCDYNHWLITIDFPKDPKPSPEEMVETYVQTCAKVVGSVEEAKKLIYACSTTTYQGFQVMVSEEMSEKFRGLPGVVFILPDSYIDPSNKEYGGDKYENGIITYRPPPVQYRPGRYGDRNRSNDRPPMQPRNQSYDHQGSAQGDRRNYAPQQNFGSRENFGPGPGPAGPGVGRDSGVQQNYPPQQNFVPSPAAPGGGRNYVAQQNYPPQQNFSSTPTGPGDGRGTGVQPNSVPQSYIPQQNYGPVPVGQQTGGRETYQAERREPMPSYQRDFPQAGRGDNMPPENRDLRGDRRNFGPAAGDYRQGAASSYSQSYPGPGEGQRFPQMEQRDGMQGGEQRNFNPPMGQMRNDQGQY